MRSTRAHAGPAAGCVLPLLGRPQGRAAARTSGRVQWRDACRRFRRLRRAVSAEGKTVPDPACRLLAHARRKLFEVFETTKSPIAEEALRRIQALYAIEADITGRPADQRQAERQRRSKPLLEASNLDEAQRRRASGKTALGKALQYSLSRWDALSRYAEDGRLSIDNNLAERLLRGIAVSRKNFCSSVPIAAAISSSRHLPGCGNKQKIRRLHRGSRRFLLCSSS